MGIRRLLKDDRQLQTSFGDTIVRFVGLLFFKIVAYICLKKIWSWASSKLGKAKEDEKKDDKENAANSADPSKKLPPTPSAEDMQIIRNNMMSQNAKKLLRRIHAEQAKREKKDN